MTDAEYKALPPFFTIFAYPETNFLLNQSDATYRTLKTDLFFHVSPAANKIYGAHLFLKEVELDDTDANIWPSNLDFLANKSAVENYVIT
jgi:hypothetical protein